jgi:hypothetical protein
MMAHVSGLSPAGRGRTSKDSTGRRLPGAEVCDDQPFGLYTCGKLSRHHAVPRSGSGTSCVCVCRNETEGGVRGGVSSVPRPLLHGGVECRLVHQQIAACTVEPELCKLSLHHICKQVRSKYR